MRELFLRCLFDGLLAFAPVAVLAASARKLGARGESAATRNGVLVAVPLTIVAAYAFRRSVDQAAYSALLSVFVAVAAVLIRRYPADPRRRVRTAAPLTAFGLAAAVVVITVRETMKNGAVLVAALELRSFQASSAVVVASILAALVAALVFSVTCRLRDRPLVATARVFWSMFMGQAVVYACHECAEARWLPASELLHTMTEPYGPEGPYGLWFTGALTMLPIAAIAAERSSALGQQIRLRTIHLLRAPSRTRNVAMMVLVALVAVIAGRIEARRPRDGAPTHEIVVELAAMLKSPHLMFRETGPGAGFSMLSVTALTEPGARRLSVGLPCDRVSFAGGFGICLQTDRRFFAGYSAVLLDRSLRPTHTLILPGSPSRTRVAEDGRVGATTVFVTGHGYAAGGFSTVTQILDMTTGDVIGNLEQFSAWRGDVRVTSADVNLWGVTFARSSNTFYATLAAAGRASLVRGDLALRKLTVLRDNVECPSLSPDNTLIAFKKRVAAGAAWRLHVLDLATMTDRPLEAESRYIDDQVEWLDDMHVLYAIRRPSSTVSDVWVASIDGGVPRVFLQAADTPVVVR